MWYYHWLNHHRLGWVLARLEVDTDIYLLQKLLMNAHCMWTCRLCNTRALLLRPSLADKKAQGKDKQMPAKPAADACCIHKE
jgi:hypothetical protein